MARGQVHGFPPCAGGQKFSRKRDKGGALSSNLISQSANLGRPPPSLGQYCELPSSTGEPYLSLTPGGTASWRKADPQIEASVRYLPEAEVHPHRVNGKGGAGGAGGDRRGASVNTPGV